MSEPISEISKLVSTRKKQTIKLPSGNSVIVQSLTFGEIGEVTSYSKDPIEQTVAMLVKGVAEPKIGPGMVKQLSPGDVRAISEAIIRLSGFTKQEIEEGKKGLGLSGVTPSSF